MDSAKWMLRWLADFYREMERGLAVMRGEEHVAGHEPRIDWSRRKSEEAASVRRCRRGCCA